MIYVNSEDHLAGISDTMTTDETNASEEDASGPLTEAQISLMSFWPTISDEVKRIKSVDAKNQVLPLARIKKIMKLDEDVKMISAEAPLLFAKAAEIFIHELTLRAWVHTEDNKRRTLQRNDIAMAITKYDQFDFLIDIVPRDEVRPTKKEPVTKTVVNCDQVQYYLQLAQQHAMQGGTAQIAQTPGQQQQQQPQQQTQQQVAQIQQPTLTSPQQIQLPAGTIQMQAQSMAGPITLGSPPNILLTNSLGIQQPQQQQQQIQLLQQIVTPNGEITHVPIQIPQNQLNLLRMQQQLQQQQQQHPIIIQTSPMHGQQILQMNHQQQAPNVFIAQSAPDEQ